MPSLSHAVPIACRPYRMPSLSHAVPIACRPYRMPSLSHAVPIACRPYRAPSLSHAVPIACRPYRMPPLSHDRVGLVLGIEAFPIQVVVPAGAVRQRALKALVSAGGGPLASHAGAGLRDGRTGTPHDDGAGT